MNSTALSGFSLAHWRPMRLFAVVDSATGYLRYLAAHGVASALETDAAQRAPVGALLVEDHDVAGRGLLHAQRTTEAWELCGP